MKTKLLLLVLVVALLLAAAGVALANGGPEPVREVLSGGATGGAGGAVTLRATLGQPIVGVVANSGGDIVISQGYWHRAPYEIYLPVVQKAP
jgi:hypothetical protein